jgi:two-component system, chemotaxis family, CheB/CheR fusion protein
VVYEPSFPIVGIGASAGGLEAFELLFRNMAEEPGMAFVITTHLAPGHHSALPEIVGRFTSMPVASAADGALLEPNRVYVCPPDNHVTVNQGKLYLHAPAPAQQRRPIDVFMSSLAEDAGERAVGVLLSGGGSDGTLGLKAIKERGGFTLAQRADGSAPQQRGMPNSAISSGVVDLVVPVQEMPARLRDLATAIQFGRAADNDDDADEERLEVLRAEICHLLLSGVGHDFNGYKDKTFMRRVRRRLQVVQLSSLEAYIDRLRQDTEEVTALFRDLLIGVTSFFRDNAAFESLERAVIPKLFEGKGQEDTVRVWVPACTTGEEVYSIAIALRERMDTLRAPPAVQIFATDIDESALAVARIGRYPAALLKNITPGRLKRFFEGDEASAAVTKDIRQMCMFSAHNVLRDPPFSRIDLVSCRNLLIYFGVDFQAKALPIFHFALKPRGYLFLGISENISRHTDLFSPIEKKSRIFQRRDHAVTRLHFPNFNPPGRAGAGFEGRISTGNASDMRQLVESRVIERHAPPHVVVNRDGDIVHYSQRTGKYLEPAAGLPNQQLVAMARRGLRLELRTALREVLETRRPVERHRIPVEIEGKAHTVDVVIEPLGSGDESDPLFLVLFVDGGQPPGMIDDASARPIAAENALADRLEQELRETRERLQVTVEEYEGALEELKSSNEELQSINEEFQSANEELETSKEELHSINEELQTVNVELNTKIEELDRAHNDLRNVFESTQIATVFLDKNLRIRSFTAAMTGIFNLIPTDIGRPLTDIVGHLQDTGQLRRDIASVFETRQMVERRVRRIDRDSHYLLRILPYFGQRHELDGALVTFVEVTSLVEAEEHQRTLVEELNHRVRNMLTVVAVIARQTLLQTTSLEAFSETFLGRIQSMGRAYTLVSREQWRRVLLDELLRAEFESYGGSIASRVSLRGPGVAFVPHAALAFGVVVHELTTNALKYGALSVEEGRVTINWDADSDSNPSTLRLVWRESGGPIVRPPEGLGFGAVLIHREIDSVLEGTCSYDWAPQGVQLTVSLPLGEHTLVLAPATGGKP